MSRTTTKRIAVVGPERGVRTTSNSVVVETRSWSKVDGTLNLRDFDGVVLDLRSDGVELALKEGRFKHALNPGTALEMMLSGTQIVVVGDPRISLPGDNDFTHWTGVSFLWENASGKTVTQNTDPRGEQFAAYLEEIGEWSFGLYQVKSRENWGLHLEKLGLNRDAVVSVTAQPIAQNRYFRPLAFELAYELKGRGLLPGRIVFLPPTDRGPEGDLGAALRAAFSFDEAAGAPMWLESIEAPGESDLKRRKQAAQSQLTALVDEITQLDEQRNDMRSPLALLFARGDQLEIGVWRVLEELGGVLTVPEKRGDEDGSIVARVNDEEHRFVLEIKGSRKPTPTERWIEQALKWAQKATSEKLDRYKGVLLLNLDCETPPEERTVSFPDAFLRRCDLFDLAVIATEDLLHFYFDWKRGIADPATLWFALSRTRGHVELRDILQRPVAT